MRPFGTFDWFGVTRRHADGLGDTAEATQIADGITVAHLAEMYVRGKLSRRDIEPINDLLEALVSGQLSRQPKR